MSPPAGPDGRPDPQDRRAQRLENAAYHAAAAAARHEAETVRARELVDAFVREARDRRLTPTALHAKPWSGAGRYRTPATGWYLRHDRSLAVGVDGAWYVLVVAPSLRARLSGVNVDPSDPPLQVGAGARDGESVALDVLLRLRLDAGDDFA